MKMYDRAAALFNQRIIVAFAHPTNAPPDGLSYMKTSGQKIKEVALRCTSNARAASREQAHRGVEASPADTGGAAASAIATLLETAEEAAAAAAATAAEATAAADEPQAQQPRARTKKAEGKLRRNKTYEGNAKKIALECTAPPPPPQISHILRPTATATGTRSRKFRTRPSRSPRCSSGGWRRRSA